MDGLSCPFWMSKKRRWKDFRRLILSLQDLSEIHEQDIACVFKGYFGQTNMERQ
jgi:hypothetical protein